MHVFLSLALEVEKSERVLFPSTNWNQNKQQLMNWCLERFKDVSRFYGCGRAVSAGGSRFSDTEPTEPRETQGLAGWGQSNPQACGPNSEFIAELLWKSRNTCESL